MTRHLQLYDLNLSFKFRCIAQKKFLNVNWDSDGHSYNDREGDEFKHHRMILEKQPAQNKNE